VQPPGIDYVAVFLGGLRAGVAVAPLPISVDARTLAAMNGRRGSADPVFWTGRWQTHGPIRGSAAARARHRDGRCVSVGSAALDDWRKIQSLRPSTFSLTGPSISFIRSGTTGVPKGIVQPHAFRWSKCAAGPHDGLGPDSITLLATPPVFEHHAGHAVRRIGCRRHGGC